MWLEALGLGVSTGLYCVMHCSPIILPFLFSENKEGPGRNAKLVWIFLAGRLLGYVAVGVLLGIAGAYAAAYLDPALEHKLSAAAYTVLGAFMIATGILYNFPKSKFCQTYSKVYRNHWGAFLIGLITGLHLCPPFFAAAARVFASGLGALQGGLYFLFFFAGTSLFLLPLFGVGFIRKNADKLKLVAEGAMLFIGVYFFLFIGIFSLIGRKA